jgi:hypothetical protein
VPVHGEMVTDAEMIQRIFVLALENEGRHIPFSGNQLVFLEALDHKHESYQTFVVLFFSPDML